MKKIFPFIALLTVIFTSIPAFAQEDEPVVIALFPFKNLDGVAKYDGLSWTFIDSLEVVINAHPNAGSTFELIPVEDVQDQMLAMNVEVSSPSYETDVFEIAKRLGASRIIFGSYLVKYEKANLSVKVSDVKTMLPDQQHMAQRIIVKYDDALSVVEKVAGKILPAFAGE
jgi:hypothetical protein